MVVNGDSQQCLKLAELLDVPSVVELLSDPTGAAGRAFGVSRGFAPDDSLSPFVKLFVMGVIGGSGSWWTLPAVLTGYCGSPGGKRGWIESALKQGQLAGRWPSTVLELGDDGEIQGNKFDTTPVVAHWGVRPFEVTRVVGGGGSEESEPGPMPWVLNDRCQRCLNRARPRFATARLAPRLSPPPALPPPRPAGYAPATEHHRRSRPTLGRAEATRRQMLDTTGRMYCCRRRDSAVFMGRPWSVRHCGF